MGKSVLSKDERKDLYRAFLNIKDEKECKSFLDDLLTEHELTALAARVRAAKLLMEGKTYVEVTNEIEISSATLARVSKCVKKGKGYSKVLKRTFEDKK